MQNAGIVSTSRDRIILNYFFNKRAAFSLKDHWIITPAVLTYTWRELKYRLEVCTTDSTWNFTKTTT